MDFIYYKNAGCMKKEGCCKASAQKLSVHDWLSDIPESGSMCNLVEVQFKNTRKGYYRNTLDIPLSKGDIIAVEASPGHDIGTVTLTGTLVELQMRKYNIRPDSPEIRRVYRIAKPADMEKFQEAKARENASMLRARELAEFLKLNMKIGDVEFQGDGSKAIFYYIADERVDFRQLIKDFAETFRVRIEMKQIGARQEAGRIGGIGPCGRELCCSSWMSTFSTVSTGSARHQDVSMNPQKLAGQCAKLKCCFNFEVDAYVEAQKRMPSRETILETANQSYFLFKGDVLKGEVIYTPQKNSLANAITLTTKQAFDIIQLNKKGIKPESLKEEIAKTTSERDYRDGVGEESLTRFDNSRNRNSRSRNNNNRNNDKNQPQRTDSNGIDSRPILIKANKTEPATPKGELAPPKIDPIKRPVPAENSGAETPNKNNRNRSRSNYRNRNRNNGSENKGGGSENQKQ